MKRKRIILDCDPGIDDAIAILLAAQSPELKVLGITTVVGNAAVQMTSINACRVLRLINKSTIRVYQGEAHPLTQPETSSLTYCGSDGFCETYLPLTDWVLAPEPAVDFIIRTLREEEDGVTIVSTGPMTNLARAILIAPNIKSQINAIVTAGQFQYIYDIQANITPCDGWNVNFDSKAAEIILNSGISIYELSKDVTFRPKNDLVEQILSSSTNFVTGKFLEHAYKYNISHRIDISSLLVDPVAVAFVIDPSIARMVPKKASGMQEIMEVKVPTPNSAEKRYDHSPPIYTAISFDFESYIKLLIERVFSRETGNVQVQS